MSDDALDIYDSHLSEQLGSGGVFTERAVYDPSGLDEAELYGIFEKTSSRSNDDGGHVSQKTSSIRFILKQMMVFDIYAEKEVYFPYREATYTIDYVDVDENGADVLWLV